MGGVDVVRYFQQRDPEAFSDQGGFNESYAGEFGNPAHSSEYAGYTFLFSSGNNKLLFDFEPQKYAPQYGGT
jgi:YHS domain-containing protein